ncbi:rhamnan synthesis F family protein [Brachyspira pulli]|uniref:rhamnan synthesis F family protein n=1 Tax=Brachyspira pulli TaxID=310721 RepID=UPI003005F3B2
MMEIVNNEYIKFFDKNIILEDIYNKDIHKLKIAIHIHLYYIDMLNIFINYLQESPINFDLFISVISEDNKNICLQNINNTSLQKLNKLYVKKVQNIGRDISSFLIDFKDDWKRYDLVCHIHSKKSLHTKEIGRWSEYLFNNLISNDAITNITSNFLLNDNLGVVFPPVFYMIYKWAINLHESDEKKIIELLNKLNINFIPNRENFIFSAGNMFWFRPKALEKLFDLNITYDDIPKEPIEYDHTILHVLERLQCIIAEQSGFIIKSYISRKELLNSFFERYDYITKIEQLNKEINDKKSEIIDIKLFKFILFAIKKDAQYFKIIILGIHFIIKLK